MFKLGSSNSKGVAIKKSKSGDDRYGISGARLGGISSTTANAVNKKGSKSARSKELKPQIESSPKYYGNCGSSSTFKSELEVLQETLKEKNDEISIYKSQAEEYDKLKEEFKTLERSYLAELAGLDIPNNQCASSMGGGEDSLRFSIRDLYSKNVDWVQKYAIATQDMKHQEEVIAQLRDKLTEKEELESVNSNLNKKYTSLETNFQSVFAELKKLRETNKKLTDENGKIRKSLSKIRASGAPSLANTQSQTEPQGGGSSTHSNQGSPGKKSPMDLTPKSSRVQGQKVKFAPEDKGELDGAEVKRQGSNLAGKLKAFKEEHANCNELHDFLRETIEKLRTDNSRLCEEINGLKVANEQNRINSENLSATLNEIRNEKERILNSYKELEGKYRTLIEKSIALRKSHDPNMIENLQKAIVALQKQCQGMKEEMEKMTEEVEKKMSQAQRELAIEKERADSCLAQSLAEREKLEKRWQDRWSRHQASLIDQLETLRSNHQGSIQSAAEREEALAKELKSFQAQYEKNKAAWEDCKKKLIGQIHEWRERYEKLTSDYDDTRKNKIHVELMFQEKTNELETLHEIVRQECEERLELRKRVEEMEQNIEKLTETDSCQELFKAPLQPRMSIVDATRTHSNEQFGDRMLHEPFDVQINEGGRTLRPESASPSILVHKTPYFISKALKEMNDQSLISPKYNPNAIEYKGPDEQSLYQNEVQRNLHVSPNHQPQMQQSLDSPQSYGNNNSQIDSSSHTNPDTISPQPNYHHHHQIEQSQRRRMPQPMAMPVPMHHLHMSMMRGKPGMGALIPGPGRQKQPTKSARTKHFNPPMPVHFPAPTNRRNLKGNISPSGINPMRMSLKNFTVSAPTLEDQEDGNPPAIPVGNSQIELGKIRGVIDSVVYTVGPGRQRSKPKKEVTLLPHEKLLRDYPGIAKYKRNFPLHHRGSTPHLRATKRYSSRLIKHSKISTSKPTLLPVAALNKNQGNGDFNYI